MQKIWGKILAGEIKQPTSFSFRTLNTLKSITTHEAKIFENICEFSLRMNVMRYIFSETKFIQKHGIKFEDILLLEECGLISSSRTETTMNINDSLLFLTHNDKICILAKSTVAEQKLDIGHYLFTKSGTELYKILNIHTSNSTIIGFANIIKAKNKNILITAHNINTVTGDNINYDLKDILI